MKGLGTSLLSQLIKTIRKETLRIRPPKQPDLKLESFANLTRVEDVLKLTYRRRKRLIGQDKGTDFSKGNKIKLELWEVQTPGLHYILILYPNINITQTISRFFFLVEEQRLILSSLTILRIDEKSNIQQSSDISLKYPGIKLTEFTLKQFIKDYCIDADFTKTEKVFEEPYFIDQHIYPFIEEDQQKPLQFAIQFFLNAIEAPTSLAAYLILAEGGDGKSSLCSSLVNTINQRTSVSGKKAILLRIDEIRQKLNSDVVNDFRISSVYDIYHLFTVIADLEPEKSGYTKMNEIEFDVSVFCGNLVVIIDGLDELYSIFQERFDKDKFISSFIDLNKQLGESTIILTSRGNLFSDKTYDQNNLGVYYLKGFGEIECSKYFDKRFSKISNDVIRKCNASAKGLMDSCGTDKISPFVVDLIAIIHSENTNEEDNNYSLDGKNYPSNSDLSDKVVFHILRRETQRQEIYISIKDIIDLFCEIVSEYGASIDLNRLKEIINTYYENQADSVYRSILVNPLIKIQSPILTFRYTFLYSYFITLFVLKGIVEECTSNDYFINAYSKFAEGITTTNYKDILKYCKSNSQDIDLHKIISTLRIDYAKEHTLLRSRAISFFVHLLVDIHGSGMSKTELSNLVIEYFLNNGKPKCIKHLFIFGDMRPIDFSGYTVSDSGFIGYSNFLKCNLDNTYFSSTTIDVDADEADKSQLHRDTFDSTCNIGSLSRYLIDSQDGLSTNEIFLRRFFRQFLKRNAFVEKKVDELIFPNAGQDRSSKFFREALNQSIIYETEDGKFCGIMRPSQKAIYNFLTNRFLDTKLHKILSVLG